MVPKKKGVPWFNGYRVTVIPKAPRSIRKRGPRKYLVKESKFCAFDLLAAVAGKLLQESESSTSSNVDEGNVQPLISLDENEKQKFVDGIGEQTEKNSILKQTSTVPTLGDVNKIDCDVKPGTCKVEKAEENSASVCVDDSLDCEPECGPKVYIKDKNHQTNTLTVKDPTEVCVNSKTVINSEDSVEHSLDAAKLKHLNNLDVGTRDDDENYSGCNKSSTKIRSFGRPQPCIGNRRIRKVLAYKYRRSDQMLKDRELYNTCEDMKSFYKYRKRIYKQRRLSAQYAYAKKRKLSENGMGIVKFSIKSFQVPELCIKVPENASFCSLKRAVMETVTSIFGSGFQVGVVLQGKKVRDDNKTLLEAGICNGSNLGALGFTLKPNFTNVSPCMAEKNLTSLLPRDPDRAVARSPSSPMIDSGISGTLSNPPVISKFDGNVGNTEFKSSSQSSTNETTDGVVTDSKAIVPVPAMNAEALAVVPVSKKPKRNEHSQAQRRIRRPFKVAEVEALIEAVEKLGTGRWRDVKMGAFEHAGHRTYVDLKDKWKTLVHTASIAPQQRRGEPVPQELLDRVLAAHSYWVTKSVETTGKEPSPPVDLLKTAMSQAPEMLQA